MLKIIAKENILKENRGNKHPYLTFGGAKVRVISVFSSGTAMNRIVSPNSQVETLIPNGLIFGDGPFGDNYV